MEQVEQGSEFESGAKMDLSGELGGIVDSLGKWCRFTGTLQLALSGVGLFFLLIQAACGTMQVTAEGLAGILIVFASLVMIVVASMYMMQALRLLTAGEQLKNLALEGDTDFLELAFSRFKVAFAIDVGVGVLMVLRAGLEGVA